MHLGKRGSPLLPDPSAASVIHLKTPILNEAELQDLGRQGFKIQTISTLFSVSDGPLGLEKKVKHLCLSAEDVVTQGNQILILSDRGVNASNTYVPPLLAVGAVHHHLLKKGLRLNASIVVETAQCWSTHHLACLIGYGASAVLSLIHI